MLKGSCWGRMMARAKMRWGRIKSARGLISTSKTTSFHSIRLIALRVLPSMRAWSRKTHCPRQSRPCNLGHLMISHLPKIIICRLSHFSQPPQMTSKISRSLQKISSYSRTWKVTRTRNHLRTNMRSSKSIMVQSIHLLILNYSYECLPIYS